MMGFQIYDYFFLRPSIATREEEEEEASQTNKKEEAAESWEEEAFLFFEKWENVCFDMGKRYNKKMIF